MNSFDIMIIGQLSKDINTDFGGRTESVIGGAVLASGFAADASGAKVAVLAKGNRAEADPVTAFARRPGVTVFPVDSATCTSISNTYLTADRERRICKAISHIEPYRPADLPDIDASIYHIAGLMAGDIGEALLTTAAGLVVGIPAMVFFFVLKSRFDIRETDARKELPHAKIPVLIIHGEADGFVPAEMSDLASCNPEYITRHTFPGADHGISYLVDPQRYKQIVRQFVEQALSVTA